MLMPVTQSSMQIGEAVHRVQYRLQTLLHLAEGRVLGVPGAHARLPAGGAAAWPGPPSGSAPHPAQPAAGPGHSARSAPPAATTLLVSIMEGWVVQAAVVVAAGLASLLWMVLAAAVPDCHCSKRLQYQPWTNNLQPAHQAYLGLGSTLCWAPAAGMQTL